MGAAQGRGSSSPESGETLPPRRPIPLPPASLRPPPRIRRGPEAQGPEPPAPVPPSEGERPPRRWSAGRTIGILAGLIVAVAVWRILPGPPRPAQALRGSTAEPEAVSAPIPVPPPPVTRAASPVPRFTVQVASFQTLHRAEGVLARASERTGLSGLVVPSRVEGVTWQRILLGAFVSEEEAREAVTPLLREGFITELVVRPVEAAWIPALTGRGPEAGDG